MMSKPFIDLMNKVDPPQKIMMFTMPMRAIRIVAMDDEFKTFHVEQLVLTSKDVHNPRGSWALLSTHGNPLPGRAWGVAVDAALKAAAKLKQKLEQRHAASSLLVPA